MTRVARLYHEERLIQSEIASKLGITQVAVSRLLKKAEENGIVRTTVVTPPGAFAELEETLEQRFGLSQVIVGEATSDSRSTSFTYPEVGRNIVDGISARLQSEMWVKKQRKPVV